MGTGSAADTKTLAEAIASPATSPLPEEEGLREKVELPLERETEGFEKIPSLMGKSDASECNESSLSNCRVQLALSTRKDGMICMQSHFDNHVM